MGSPRAAPQALPVDGNGEVAQHELADVKRVEQFAEPVVQQGVDVVGCQSDLNLFPGLTACRLPAITENIARAASANRASRSAARIRRPTSAVWSNSSNMT